MFKIMMITNIILFDDRHPAGDIPHHRREQVTTTNTLERYVAKKPLTKIHVKELKVHL